MAVAPEVSVELDVRRGGSAVTSGVYKWGHPPVY